MMAGVTKKAEARGVIDRSSFQSAGREAGDAATCAEGVP
jgi:hypothetical protein